MRITDKSTRGRILLEQVGARNPERVDGLLAIWEDAVRATHHFLDEDAIRSLRPLVGRALLGIETLVVAREASGAPVGFMGIEKRKLEMLFLSPRAFGRGLGKWLLTVAVRRFDVILLDVNEQNPSALGFYVHLGFEVYARSGLDGQGNPFPILHMRRSKAGKDA